MTQFDYRAGRLHAEEGVGRAVAGVQPAGVELSAGHHRGVGDGPAVRQRTVTTLT